MMIHFEHPSFKYVKEDEECIKIMLPSHKEVCPSCSGIGTHERRDIDCSLMVDTMREDNDEDGLAGYFGGDYDVTCTTCKGCNVVDQIDYDFFMREFPEYHDALVSWEESERESELTQAQERACGA